MKLSGAKINQGEKAVFLFLFELGLVPKGAINQEAPGPQVNLQSQVFLEQASLRFQLVDPKPAPVASERRWLSTI